MSYELRKEDLEGFFAATFQVYPADSPYVSPMRSDLARLLDAERNPLFRGGSQRRFWTLRRNGEPVGRIVALVHPQSNEKFGWRRCQFGFFDCADDRQAAAMLLGAAEAWARKQGCDELVGSFNLTAMQQMGIVTDGFDRQPYTDMHYNPPHLPRLLEAHGYERHFPMSTFETDLESFDPESLLGAKQRALLDDPALHWQPIRRRRFTARMEEVCGVLNDGFEDNPMFVALSQEEFLYQAREMMWIIDPRISWSVADQHGPVGVVICIPDLNPFLRDSGSQLRLSTPWHFLRHRWRRRRAVIIFYSVRRQWHGRGVAGALLFHVTRSLRDAGYRHLGTTWISDDNAASRRQMEKLGGCPLHRLHLFRKPLEPT